MAKFQQVFGGYFIVLGNLSLSIYLATFWKNNTAMWSHCYWDSKAQPFLPSGFLKVNLAFSLSAKMHQPSSVTRWLEFVFKVWIFKTLKNCCFGKMFVKVGWKFCPKLNKPSKDWQKVLKIGQSGEISSNLVTLRPTDRSIDHWCAKSGFQRISGFRISADFVEKCERTFRIEIDVTKRNIPVEIFFVYFCYFKFLKEWNCR